MVFSILPSSQFRPLRPRPIAWIAGAILVLGLAPAIAAAEDQAQIRSTQDVRSDLKNFYEAFLSRPVPAEELDPLTKEFISYFGSDRCQSDCARILRILQNDTPLMRDKSGQPEELFTRHLYVAINFFDPKLKDSVQLRLLTEPDPVRVVDPRAKRLMTENDVAALANLQILACCGKDEPEERSYSAEEIGKGVQLLDAKFGAHPDAVEMPVFFNLAAPFWSGVKSEWPNLDAGERQAVRDYIQDAHKNPMPQHLYGRLFGVNEDVAREMRFQEKGKELPAAALEAAKDLPEALSKQP